MRTTRRPSAAQNAITSRPDDRRTRQRLRDLCDEVIWSFRIASDRDLISAKERAEAQAFLSHVAPIAH